MRLSLLEIAIKSTFLGICYLAPRTCACVIGSTPATRLRTLSSPCSEQYCRSVCSGGKSTSRFRRVPLLHVSSQRMRGATTSSASAPVAPAVPPMSVARPPYQQPPVQHPGPQPPFNPAMGMPSGPMPHHPTPPIPAAPSMYPPPPHMPPPAAHIPPGQTPYYRPPPPPSPAAIPPQPQVPTQPQAPAIPAQTWDPAQQVRKTPHLCSQWSINV